MFKDKSWIPSNRKIQNFQTRILDRCKYGWIKSQFLKRYHTLRKSSIVNLGGIKIKLNPYISENIRDYIYLGDYEGYELNLLRKVLQKDDVVLEIGTGLGLLSSFCAKSLGNNSVFTYEANPELEPHIRENYKINGVNPSLEICLIGELNGEADFYLKQDFWSSSVIPRGSDVKVLKVPVKSFNQEIFRINPTLLIIDIEGGEYELVKYANFHNVRKLIIEVHAKIFGSQKFNYVINKLTEAGFEVNETLSGKEELFLERNCTS
jgi:FkbM family methyltransferase